jgi:hypothetical protein
VLQDEILGEIGEEMRARRSLTRLSPDVAGSQFRSLAGI